MLGGTQSLHTNSYDEALALPSEEAVRIALRTQQVIAHETGVTNTIDPLGGSYFVEALTDELEAQAYEYFRKIDELGGMVEAVKARLPAARDRRGGVRAPARDRPRRADRRRRQRLPRGRRRASSRSCASTPRSSASRSAACRPCARAATASRSSAALAELRTAAADDAHNLMPNLLACARVHATEGEIVEALQEVFGTYTETPVF